MLYFGTTIKESHLERLQPVTAGAVFQILTDPGSALADQTARIRRLRALDVQAYGAAKQGLPFVTGSAFTDGLRQKTYFERANYAVVDLDACFRTALERQRLGERIRQMCPPELLFTSPSGQGLKLFYRLEPPCFDAGQYTLFYRKFASHLAEHLQLNGIVDLRTCDVSRACFLCHDPEAVFDPTVPPLAWGGLLPAEAQRPEPPSVPAVVASDLRAPDADTYRHLRQLVNPGRPARPPGPEPFVPERLREAEAMIRPCFSAGQIRLTEVLPIRYGLKLKFREGPHEAELNVFYGKRGFSVIRSPRSGTDPALNDAVYQQVFDLLFRENTEASNEVPF